MQVYKHESKRLMLTRQKKSNVVWVGDGIYKNLLELKRATKAVHAIIYESVKPNKEYDKCMLVVRL